MVTGLLISDNISFSFYFSSLGAAAIVDTQKRSRFITFTYFIDMFSYVRHIMNLCKSRRKAKLKESDKEEKSFDREWEDAERKIGSF